MKNLKFRIYDKTEKRMKYLDSIWNMPDPSYDFDEVQQFTGLLDKLGKEIYEGDILEEDTEWWQVQYTDRAMFEAIGIGSSHIDFALEEISGSATVQGNIYENPELIK